MNKILISVALFGAVALTSVVSKQYLHSMDVLRDLVEKSGYFLYQLFCVLKKLLSILLDRFCGNLRVLHAVF